MTGLVRKATLLVVCGLTVLAASALAGQPDPSKCTVPAYVTAVGSASGVTSAFNAVTITVRDLNNTPIQNSLVVLDFTLCTDLAICNDQLNVALISGCPNPPNPSPQPTVRGYTDINGQIVFKVRGLGRNLGNTAGISPASPICVNITADGYGIGTAKAPILDQNGKRAGTGGTAGLDATDLVAVLIDIGAGVYRGRSDINRDNAMNALDLTTMLIQQGAGTSSQNCTPVSASCPNP